MDLCLNVTHWSIHARKIEPDLIDGMRIVLDRLQGLHGELARPPGSVTAADEAHHAQHFEDEGGPRRQLQQVVRTLRRAVPLEAGKDKFRIERGGS